MQNTDFGSFVETTFGARWAAAWAVDLGRGGTLRVRTLSGEGPGPIRPPLDDEVFLWLDPASAARHDAWVEYLAIDERERLAQLARPDDRRSFAAAHGGVRCLLGPMLGCNPRDVGLARSPQGKPMLDLARHGDVAHRIHFSLSHTDGQAMVGLASHPIGVDVEAIRDMPDLAALAAAAMPHEAIAEIAAAPDADARYRLFFRTWTLSEALVKATGEGMGEGFAHFAFDPTADVRLRRGAARLQPLDRWRFGVVT